MVHGIARQNLVADGKAEREAEDDACLACTIVALSGELFEEVVAAGDSDFTQSHLFEEWEHEGAHVPFVQQSGGAREAVFKIYIFEPVRHEGWERTIGGHSGESRMEQIAFGELLLQVAFGGWASVGRHLDVAALAVPVPIPSAGDVASADSSRGGDNAECPDRCARSNHVPPSR